jgi:hypothetical protein
MKCLLLAAALVGAVALTGCHTPLPPGAEPGPHHTMAYYIHVETSEPGVRVECNGEYMGNSPIKIKVFGDPDGTFHDFGSPYFIIRALPNGTNQYVQTRVFRTGHGWGPEDHIPDRVFMDMHHVPPPQPGPPVVYGPSPVYVVPPPFYYEPGVRVFIGPRFPHHRRW